MLLLVSGAPRPPAPPGPGPVGPVHRAGPTVGPLAGAAGRAAADPGLIAVAGRICADPSDPAPATRWWEELTAAGGEGMVVKPAANLTRGTKGLVQPGLKAR